MEELLEKKEEPDKKKDRVLVVIIIVLAAALVVIKIVEFIADGEFQQTDATNENVIIQWRGKRSKSLISLKCQKINRMDTGKLATFMWTQGIIIYVVPIYMI